MARLSQTCHAIVAGAELTGQVVKARRQSRAAIDAELQEIDTIARRVLGLNGGDDNAAEDTPPPMPPPVEC